MRTSPNEISRRLAVERRRRKLSQEAAAEVLRVAQATLSRWENGSRLPDAGHVPALAEFLRMGQLKLYEAISAEREKNSPEQVTRDTLELARELAQLVNGPTQKGRLARMRALAAELTERLGP